MDEEEKESEQISSKVQEKEVPDEKNEVPIPAHAPVKKKRKDVLKELEENLSRLKSAEQDDSPAASDLPSNLHPGEDSHELELMAAIRAREEKNIQDEKKQIQDELIDEFNKKTVKFKIIPNTEEAGETTDLSIESTRIKEDLLSESFAKILVRQKKFKEAKEIYKKLQLKFPDKKAYFADCLKQLENN
ncbi:hypothetical protein [Lunatibacter salilacus]|uniref:hypothetical protein n=1 Tax=Lunatibacter salilacus TaxID=2483804 RepID=UPI00131AFEF7|nr:hypothetical protein [Lunatibacter salilacus]